MGWIGEAERRGELKVTDDRNCPFCNPQHRTDKPTQINACERHRWVYREWYENWREKTS